MIAPADPGKNQAPAGPGKKPRHWYLEGFDVQIERLRRRNRKIIFGTVAILAAVLISMAVRMMGTPASPEDGLAGGITHEESAEKWTIIADE